MVGRRRRLVIELGRVVEHRRVPSRRRRRPGPCPPALNAACEARVATTPRMLPCTLARSTPVYVELFDGCDRGGVAASSRRQGF